MIAVLEEAMIKGALVETRSDIMATATVRIVARAYGGTVNS